MVAPIWPLQLLAVPVSAPCTRSNDAGPVAYSPAWGERAVAPARTNVRGWTSDRRRDDGRQRSGADAVFRLGGRGVACGFAGGLCAGGECEDKAQCDDEFLHGCSPCRAFREDGFSWPVDEMLMRKSILVYDERTCSKVNKFVRLSQVDEAGRFEVNDLASKGGNLIFGLPFPMGCVHAKNRELRPDSCVYRSFLTIGIRMIEMCLATGMNVGRFRADRWTTEIIFTCQM